MIRGLQIGISTLMAHQRAIDVTSQNIANINTPGYQRQRVNFRELSGPSGLKHPPVLGNGVYAQGVSRFATPFIDDQIRRQRGIGENYALTEELLEQVESVLTEPSSTGINARLDEFWNSWQTLATMPAEDGARIVLIQAGTQLTSAIKEARDFIQGMHDNLPSQVSVRVQRINDIGTELAQLNEQIIRANAQYGGPGGAVPVEQRRSALLFELSDLTDFRLVTEDSGMSRVTIGINALVDDGGAHSLAIDENGLPVWSANGREFAPASGQMKALLDIQNTRIPNVIAQLDELAVSLRDQVNAIHRAGYGIDGSTGLDFFVGGNASTLAVNPDIVTSSDKIATGDQPNSIGDSSVALRMVGLSSALTMGTPPTHSLNGFFRSAVTDLGLRIRHASGSKEASDVVLAHLEDRRQAISGVSMDEEVANLLSFEKAFQAGARIINVVDEMLDQVINRMGLVGR